MTTAHHLRTNGDVWAISENVARLKSMWAEGASATEIALALAQGVTRNMVIGKVHRLKLQKRDTSIRPKARQDRSSRNTTPLITGKKGRAGNPGVPSVHSIMHRMEGRAKIKPPREIAEDGVDVSHLLGGTDRKIGHQCGWVHGTPGDGEWGYCGKPTVNGTEWCESHFARVYPSKVPT
jgi:GcrA cell cycle regulator